MSVNLLTKQHLEFLSLNEAAQARLSLHLSKCHIVGNHMSWLICNKYQILISWLSCIFMILNRRCRRDARFSSYQVSKHKGKVSLDMTYSIVSIFYTYRFLLIYVSY